MFNYCEASHSDEVALSATILFAAALALLTHAFMTFSYICLDSLKYTLVNHTVVNVCGFGAAQVDLEDVPDYYEIIVCPMDFMTMMEKIESGEYLWCVLT